MFLLAALYDLFTCQILGAVAFDAKCITQHDELAPPGTPCGTNDLCGIGFCDVFGACDESAFCLTERSDLRALTIAIIVLSTFALALAFAFLGWLVSLLHERKKIVSKRLGSHMEKKNIVF